MLLKIITVLIPSGSLLAIRFKRMPGSIHEGVPQEVFFALSFDGHSRRLNQFPKVCSEVSRVDTVNLNCTTKESADLYLFFYLIALKKEILQI
jgi:hypothetical protein